MRRIWAAALSAILLLSACARQESPSPPPAETPAEGQTLRLAEAVQNEKDGVILRAEKLEDGMLTIRLGRASASSAATPRRAGIPCRMREAGS